jgi:hypothetical protein
LSGSADRKTAAGRCASSIVRRPCPTFSAVFHVAFSPVATATKHHRQKALPSWQSTAVIIRHPEILGFNFSNIATDTGAVRVLWAVDMMAGHFCRRRHLKVIHAFLDASIPTCRPRRCGSHS